MGASSPGRPLFLMRIGAKVTDHWRDHRARGGLSVSRTSFRECLLLAHLCRSQHCNMAAFGGKADVITDIARWVLMTLLTKFIGQSMSALPG